MAFSFSTNKNTNDVYVDKSGNLALSNGLQNVLELCEHAVKCRLGEVFFDISTGVPYFETVFIGSPALPSYEASIRTALMVIPNVVEVNLLEISILNNTLFYKIQIVTTFGTGVISATGI